MKWLSLSVIAILNLASLVFAQQIFNPLEQSGLPCDVLVHFYQLWEDSSFGQDPNRTERSAWIVRNSGGKNECRKWPRSADRNKEFWTGPVPYNTVAQAHTHTVAVDPKPSQNDRIFSNRTNTPLYTISGKGIWKVTPDGEITKEANQDWWKELNKGQCKESN